MEHARQLAAVSAGRISPYVEVHETHTGVVVLVGDKAYKAKKPVVTDFLDFSTADRRERACAREVLLNSRLAPESYLGVGHWSDPAGGPAEPIVVMRRYPDSRRLSTLVKHGAAAESELADIAEALATFHTRACHSRAVDAQGKAGAISARWEENLAELKDFAGTVVPLELIEQVEALARQYIAGRTALFGRRIADKCVVDGHGDLMAEDTFCMPDGPVLLDCLDFDDRLRYVDRIDDAAFLAMDLEFLGRNDLADYFLDTYSTAAKDDAPASLKHFYIAYRAVVRAKVDCIRFEQGHPEASGDASRHLTLALEHLMAGAPRLVLIGGAPGTGKTTLAHSLGNRVGAEVISTDDVRRELRRQGTIDGEGGLLDEGLYRPDQVAAVYHDVIRRARLSLTSGRSVILDGTWRDPRQRRLAHALASQTASILLEIVCWTSVGAAVGRVEHRAAGASDATPHIARALAMRDDAWETAHPIDTSQALCDCTDRAETLWRNVH
ncbi:bifunctional aminoglycoside phosphotransferase/ATP-binding protein [Candidatus Mycobacterium methanotrophicum]|uniref:AAA family ATPase n=1 Tax=Candidatus Mycobacterium methanotrophicum TaxID=2943498 RepID=A0ABY4QK34_9MYCO|nr:bifunctional aminoglycoside phosphotransferase/ATP-binding protein [Candidatus Mycobacterium methanotrophicum]UQX10351.1 AAA family ATPase [Candidatus Mycobacterium methanotrophicum]